MWADLLGILMFLDTIVYNFVDYLYDIFVALAKANIFGANDYQTIVKNIYAVLGVIMLFVLAYSLLKAVINPDEFAKGESSFPKLVKNVVVSLAIIAVLPTVFTFAFNFQNSVLNQGTITKLIFGADDEYSAASRKNAGKEMAYYVLTAFLHPNIDWCAHEGYDINKDDEGNDVSDINLSVCAEKINANGWIFLTNGESFASTTRKFLNGLQENPTGEYYRSLSAFNRYGESAADGYLTYDFIISTIAGAFMLVVLFNFCFDMALRVIKLMFFQIIAPIPVVCRVIPGGKLKDVFNDWTKKTLSTYVEVFIRVAVMDFGVYMVSMVVENWTDANLGILRWDQWLIAEAMVIMGIVMFMRQAPKLIGDMLHLDSGGMSFGLKGLKERLAMGGAFTAGAAVGGLFGTGLTNAVSAVKNFKSTKGESKSKRFGAALSGVGSVLAGAGSGLIRGGYRARNAQNYCDMKKASGEAIAGANAAKAKRAERVASYKANYRKANNNQESKWINTVVGVPVQSFMDNVKAFGAKFGIGESFDALKGERDFIGQITSIDDNTDSIAVDLLGRDSFANSRVLMSAASGNTYNMSLSAMKKRLEQLGNIDFNSVRGQTLTDFRGNQVAITDENSFATFAADMQEQLNEAERNAKRYIKIQGYSGAVGVQNLTALGINLGDGESQRLEKLHSDRVKIEELVRDNQTSIDDLNSHVADPRHHINEINDGTVGSVTGAWEQMNQLVTNAKNRNIEIDSEIARMTREAAKRNGNSKPNQ